MVEDLAQVGKWLGTFGPHLLAYDDGLAVVRHLRESVGDGEPHALGERAVDVAHDRKRNRPLRARELEFV